MRSSIVSLISLVMVLLGASPARPQIPGGIINVPVSPTGPVNVGRKFGKAITLGANQSHIYNLTTNPPSIMNDFGLAAGTDVAITPNGTIGVAMGGSVIHFYDMASATILGTSAMAGAGDGADWVAVTNTRAITLGANQAHIYDLTTSPPSIMNNFGLGSGTDVAITPGGKVGVAMGANLIHFYDMASATILGTSAMAGGGDGSDWVVVK